MKIRLYALILFCLFGTTGCYATITGTVLDSETGEPIEGAIVLVEWTKTKGFGLTYHEVYKIIEVVTDKDGTFTISGTYSPFVDPPEVVIYKKGFIAWRNDFIFPGWKRRTDFKYSDGIVIKLEHFKEVYSKDVHHSFMGHGIMTSGLHFVPKFSNALNDELGEALQEIKNRKSK